MIDEKTFASLKKGDVIFAHHKSDTTYQPYILAARVTEHHGDSVDVEEDQQMSVESDTLRDGKIFRGSHVCEIGVAYKAGDPRIDAAYAQVAAAKLAGSVV